MAIDILIGAALAAVTLLPLAWKWQLGVPRAFVAIVALAIAWGSLLRLLDVELIPAWLQVWVLTGLSAVAILAYRFYRDPERQPPEQDDLVVSPADGEVIYVRRSREGRVPASTKNGRAYNLDELTRTPLVARDAVVVGIALSFLDVHVNRAPIAGRVTSFDHHRGTFASLRDAAAVLENERATIVIEREGLQVAVVLIASRLVRRIAARVQAGQQVALGERVGMIKFGSQVDVVLPEEAALAVEVQVGDRVRAGESVLVRLERVTSGRLGSAADHGARR